MLNLLDQLRQFFLAGRRNRYCQISIGGDTVMLTIAQARRFEELRRREAQRG